MERTYMVVSYGQSKKDKSLYCRAYRVKEDENHSYGYLDEKDVYYCDEQKPLGTIFKVELMER